MNKFYSNFYDKIKLSEAEQIKLINYTINQESKSTTKLNKRRLICYTCSVAMLALLIFNFSTCIAFCKSAYNGLLGIVNVNDKQVILDETKTVSIKIPDNMEVTEYDGVKYQSKVYQSIPELENEIGLELLHFPYSVNSRIVLQIQDDKDVLIHIEPEIDEEREPEMVFINFSIVSSGKDGEVTYDDTKAKSYTDKNGDINVEELGDKYDIIETYKSKALGVKIAIVKDTLTSNNDSVDQDSLDVYYNAIFVYKNVEYRICLNGTESDIKQCVEKFN